MSLTNQKYIEKYKLDNVIIANDYKTNDGIVIDGIVNPLKIDNRHLCSPTDNQGSTPHCAGFSVANFCEAVYWKETGKPIQVDAHQIYAKAKEIDKNYDSDGTFPDVALMAAIQLGALPRKDYKIGVVTNDGSPDLVEKIKFLIHKHDFLICGFRICNSWYRCGIVCNKIYDNKNPLGGHAVLGCGYNKDCFYIQNSWGPNWGAKGFAQLPWDTFLKEFIYCAYVYL